MRVRDTRVKPLPFERTAAQAEAEPRQSPPPITIARPFPFQSLRSAHRHGVERIGPPAGHGAAVGCSVADRATATAGGWSDRQSASTREAPFTAACGACVMHPGGCQEAR